MRLLFSKSKWEMWNSPLETFLGRAKSDGFDAVEVYLPALSEDAATIRSRLNDYGLPLVAQISADGETVKAQIESLKRCFDFACETDPLLINAHTGRDNLSFEQNSQIFEVAVELAAAARVLVTHETHRGRAMYCIPETQRYLHRISQLQINADFSHWLCVHESDLSGFAEGVDLAIQRAGHIHARVGYSEGPQVLDPLSPASAEATAHSMQLWQRILDARRAEGRTWFTITPEFGPPPYMPCDRAGKPLADAWEVNCRFLQHLRLNLH